MTLTAESKIGHPVLWITLAAALIFAFGSFLASLWRAWLESPESSYGILIPIIVAYLLWTRREEFQEQRSAGRAEGLGLVLAGCGLHVSASLSGTLLASGVGFALVTMGTTLYLWGPRCLRIAAAPLALLIFMVPLPSYILGGLSWYLQRGSSTISSVILRFFGVPVFQDGNLVNLPNYVLEVKEACSGSRSVFALLALALVQGLRTKDRSWIRIVLILAAPVLAVCGNVVRIVGTGFIARRWGSLAANESLHAAWGVLVFVLAVMGLLGFRRFLRWATNQYAWPC
jgi:exosortase